MNHADFLHTPVQSAVLSSIGYSSDRTLELTFRNGAIYRYFAVPPSVFHALLQAASKGTFFNRHVRNQFCYQQTGLKPLPPLAQTTTVDLLARSTTTVLKNWGAARKRGPLTRATRSDRLPTLLQ